MTIHINISLTIKHTNMMKNLFRFILLDTRLRSCWVIIAFFDAVVCFHFALWNSINHDL